jgi:hypothetical protein
MAWLLFSIEHFNTGLNFNPVDKMITVCTTLYCTLVLRVHLCVLLNSVSKMYGMFHKRHNQMIIVMGM